MQLENMIQDDTSNNLRGGSKSLIRKPSMLPRPSSLRSASVSKNTPPDSSNNSYNTLSKSTSFSSSDPSTADGSSSTLRSKRDRVNTPGKLRAFFDVVKRDKSAGDNTPIPQKYKEMISNSRPQSGDTSQQSIISSPREDQSRRSTINGRNNKITVVNGKTKSFVELKDRQDSFNSAFDIVGDNSDASVIKSYNQIAKSFAKKTGKQDLNQAKRNSQTSEASRESMYSDDLNSSIGSTFNSSGNNKSFSDETFKEEEQLQQQQPKSPKYQPKIIGKGNGPSQKQANQSIQQPLTQTDLSESPEGDRTQSAKKRSPTPDGMVRCEFCERTFNPDRLEKHQTVCTNSPTKKTRKVFDGTTIRTKGTEMEKFIKRGQKQQSQVQPQSKKSDWRKKHEEFLLAVKSAKMK